MNKQNLLAITIASLMLYPGCTKYPTSNGTVTTSSSAQVSATPQPTITRSYPQEFVQSENYEYAIYSYLVGELFWGEHYGDPYDLIVINEQTVNPKIPDGILSSGAVSKEILDDFGSQNQQPRILKGQFDMKLIYKMMSKDRYIPPDSDEFKKKYPKAKGILNLSRIGFSEDRKEALVYAEIVCGDNCGKSGYWLITEENRLFNIKRL